MNEFKQWLKTELACAIFGEALAGGNPHTPPLKKAHALEIARVKVNTLKKVVEQLNAYCAEESLESE